MSAPTGVTVGTISGSTVPLSWTNGSVTSSSDGACTAAFRQENRIERSLDGSTNWISNGVVGPTVTSTNANVPDGNWYFRVVAVEHWYVDLGGGCNLIVSDWGSSVVGPHLIGDDTYPDAFDFTDVANQEKSAVVTSNTITVTGITAATPISISGGISPEYRINGGSWTSAAGNVNNNDTVQIRATSASTFSTTTTTTLDIGTRTDDWAITTQNLGGSVTAPASGTISYDDIRACWGPSTATDVDMNDWRKNGPYWQDLPENASVPTGNPFDLSDFYGIKGIWQLSTPAPVVMSGASGTGQTASASYLPTTAGVVPLEFKISVVSGSTAGCTFNLTNPLDTWRAFTTWQISYTDTEDSSIGATLRLHIRPVGSTTEVTQDITLSLVIGLGGP
jgi:hypothetical protein